MEVNGGWVRAHYIHTRKMRKAGSIFKTSYVMSPFKSKLMLSMMFNDSGWTLLGLQPQSLCSGMLCSGSVSACDKAGRWPITLELLRFTQQLRVLLNRVSYNAAISACETKSKWQQAVSVMYQMTHVRSWFIV